LAARLCQFIGLTELITNAGVDELALAPCGFLDNYVFDLTQFGGLRVLILSLS